LIDFLNHLLSNYSSSDGEKMSGVVWQILKQRIGQVSCRVCVQGQSFPLHLGVSVTGIFNDLAAVAFLPPPHSIFAALRMAAVSPTAKSLKIRSDSANNVAGKQLPPE
jgi:hypothetical protein